MENFCYKPFIYNSNCNKKNWQHVNSSDNPADIISIGLMPCDLVNCDLWFHGLPWLQIDCSEWPYTKISEDVVQIEKNAWL